MAGRELVVLGTAGYLPTRTRNHNGYLLRWDGLGLLFDCGEGTQRQMTLAGVSGPDVHRICLTHLHGDHCLGLPGVLLRMAADAVRRPVPLHYPASGAEYVERLRYASAFHGSIDVREEPVGGDGPVAEGPFGVLEARRLDHGVEAFGYRLVEPDGRRMLPERLAAAGLHGRAVGELRRAGSLEVDGTRVTLDQVSVPQRGQRFAFVMDTRLCDAVFDLADRADLLVIESTFLAADEHLARERGHLTAAQAGRVAAECGVRRLVLTHFSQRYPDAAAHGAEAAGVFDGDIVVAEDLARVAVPGRAEG